MFDFVFSRAVRLEDLQDVEGQDPEITPGLFEGESRASNRSQSLEFSSSGDQAIDNDLYSYFRVGLKWDVFPEKLWPNRTIPYAISPLYEPEDQITILTAIRTLNAMTCLKFVKWNGKADDFLLIWPIKYPRVSRKRNGILSFRINHRRFQRVAGRSSVKSEDLR